MRFVVTSMPLVMSLFFLTLITLNLSVFLGDVMTYLLMLVCFVLVCVFKFKIFQRLGWRNFLLFGFLTGSRDSDSD